MHLGSQKPLTEVAATGAPYGIKNSISKLHMQRQLNLNGKKTIAITDSLSFKM